MDKDKKKKINIWKWLFVLVIILAIVVIYQYNKKLTQDYYSNKKKAEAHLVKLMTEAKTEIETQKNKYEILKKQFEGIKDVSDLLKRDIKLYIETTHPKVPSIVADAIAENITNLSKEYKISPELIVGITKVESSFNPMAVGSKTKYGHARGLMQIMPEWVKKLNLKDQYDFHEIDIGIESGIKVFLIHLEEGKGDISTGLYYYVNKDKAYVGKVYEAIGKFVAFRSTIDEEDQNVETDIDLNGDQEDEKGDQQ